MCTDELQFIITNYQIFNVLVIKLTLTPTASLSLLILFIKETIQISIRATVTKLKNMETSLSEAQTDWFVKHDRKNMLILGSKPMWFMLLLVDCLDRVTSVSTIAKKMNYHVLVSILYNAPLI